MGGTPKWMVYKFYNGKSHLEMDDLEDPYDSGNSHVIVIVCHSYHH